MKEDLLYHLFEKHLTLATQSGNESQATHMDLVKSVASAYFQHLSSSGHVPFRMIQVVIEDLETEVLDMYRKKTYGSFNLSSYKSESRSKRKS